ncbi:MAG: GspH/FimT family pseudopilin [Gallionella sp.]|nr:GspH/FimT family pseudopilin [Gallionella sp.]
MFSKRQAGVTLVELMIVVVIAAIMAAVAAPSFSSFIQNTRLTSTMAQLTGDLNRARSEAIKRNSRILVCAHAVNGTACADTSWNNGWLVCYDNDPQDNACDTAPVDGTNPNPMVIRQAINSRLVLTGTAATIRFNPNGTANTAANLALCCLSAAPYASSAVIAATGHISKL